MQAMLTWYQGNFTRVLHRLASSEAMAGKKRGKEHIVDFAYQNTSDGPG